MSFIEESDPLAYLTCTGGQTVQFNKRHSHGFVSLNQVLQERANTHPDTLVAGFPELKNDKDDERNWQVLTFTFASLLQASNAIAAHYVRDEILRPREANDGLQNRIIALLSPSCADFLVFVFAALRLGYGVLLIAPQNSPEAIRHLCLTTKCTHLVYHPTHEQLACNAFSQPTKSPHDADVQLVSMPPRSTWRPPCPLDPAIFTFTSTLSASEEKDTIAIIFHTSGSTGMPKPIVQTHRVWTEGLPCIPGVAAFTTTPLYHGGMMDFFRSLVSRTTLYLFSSLYPITVSNVIAAVAACPATRAFLSVPYILKMLCEGEGVEGMEMLKGMKLVSTGGAPLPEETGNWMVSEGVNLVSRLGSSECGFLMSSARNYATDKAWSWLRDDAHSLNLLRFELASDTGNYELVVCKDFPTLNASNRPDGAFATGDLYTPHPSITHAWRYAGRADDIIVLTTGKKPSASTLESTLRASPLVADALVFGAGRPCLGVLILPSAAPSSASREAILDVVRRMNNKMPAYAYVIDEMVVILPAESTFPKASKGTVLRPLAYKQYAEAIERAYQGLEGCVKWFDGREGLQGLNGEELIEYTRETVRSVLSEGDHGFGDNDDLFLLGMTSVKAIQLRSKLQHIVQGHVSANVVYDNPSVNRLVRAIEKIRNRSHLLSARGETLIKYVRDATQSLLPEGVGYWGDDDDLFVLGMTSMKAIGLRSKLQQVVEGSFPANVVCDNASVNRLVKVIEKIRDRNSSGSENRMNDEDVYSVMRELITKYGIFTNNEELWEQPIPCLPNGEYTRHVVVLTGATGALGTHILAHILSHEESEVIALVRAEDDSTAEKRVIESLTTRGLPNFHDMQPIWNRIKCLAVRLGERHLGLEESTYDVLRQRVTLVIHAAWNVNFVASLESFGPVHLAGIRNLIDLAITSPSRASVIFCSSVAAVANTPIPDLPVAESLSLSPTAASFTGYSRSKWVAEHICGKAHEGQMKGRIRIARIGQLCGDTQNGMWNESEGWPLLIGSVRYAGCLPALKENPSWLPVDIAAQVVLDIAHSSAVTEETDSIPVYHVVNPNTSTSWSDVLTYLSLAGLHFETVPPGQWLERLNHALLSRNDAARTRAMLDMWHVTYSSDDEAQKQKARVIYDNKKVGKVSVSMKDPPPIDAALIDKSVESWRRSGFLPPSQLAALS